MQRFLQHAARAVRCGKKKARVCVALSLLFAGLPVLQGAPAESPPVQEWVARYNGPASYSNVAEALAVDAVGDVYVTGYSDARSTYHDYVTVKYDGATGQQIWAARYNGPGNGTDIPVALKLDVRGDVIVTGYSEAGTVLGSTSPSDYATVKYDGATGQQIWVSRYDPPGLSIDKPAALAVDSVGDVYVTGASQLGPGPSTDYATVKYSGSTGQQLWESRYNGPANRNDRAASIAVDQSGNVLVTGSSSNGSFDEFATVKYAGTTGQQLWSVRYGGSRSGNDQPAAVAVDASGDVYVTGIAVGSNGANGYTTIKYSGTSGQQLWLARYSSITDSPTALAVDVSGDVYVTGQSVGASGNLDFATIKYAGASGRQLWNARYNGPNDGSDIPTGLITDAAGNVYVTGRSLSANSPGDCPTVKYDGSSGQELWVATYDGPAHLDDSAAAIAVDGAGSVYVTGSSYDSNKVSEYVTLKYRQNTPTLTDVAVTNITTTAAVVTWNTGVRATTTLEYGTNAAYGTTRADGAYVSAHSVPLTGLRPGTRYYYRASSSLVDGTILGPVTGSFATQSIPPSITWGSPSPPTGSAGWNNTPVDLPFAVSPADAGSIDPPSPLHLTGEGWNVSGTVSVTDAAGSTTTFTSPSLKIDRTAPHTTATLAGAGGQNGWYVRPVTVHLEGADALSGVAATYYQLDGGPVQPFTGNFGLTTLGSRQLQFWSVDRAGNTEATQSVTLRLEASGPVVTLRAQPTSPNAPNGGTAKVSVTGTVFNTQAGLDPQQVSYTVADQAGKAVGSGKVTLDRRGQYHFAVRLQGPSKGGAPLPYVITVRAQDRAGAIGQGGALVRVR